MKKILEYVLRTITYLPAPYMQILTAPFRKWSRSVWYNYVLQNGKYMKRLDERGYTRVSYGWLSLHGFVKRRKINKLTVAIAFFLWMWQDDDSNEDTTDIGYVNTISIGADGYRTGGVDRSKGLLNFLYGKLLPKYGPDDVTFGNTFDMGDRRVYYPYFNFWSTWVWARRNRAMNMKYYLFNY